MIVKRKNKRFPKAKKLLLPRRKLTWQEIWMITSIEYKRKMSHPVLKTLNIVLLVLTVVSIFYYFVRNW